MVLEAVFEVTESTLRQIELGRSGIAGLTKMSPTLAIKIVIIIAQAVKNLQHTVAPLTHDIWVATKLVSYCSSCCLIMGDESQSRKEKKIVCILAQALDI